MVSTLCAGTYGSRWQIHVRLHSSSQMPCSHSLIPILAKDRDRGDSTRDFGDWTRKGPLPDLPSRTSDRRPGPSEFTDRRPPRESPADDRVRDFGNWERKGPLSPLPQQERPAASRDGSLPRTGDTPSESTRGARRASPASWGEGRQEGSRPPRRDISDRPERVPSAAERDMQWRSNMRPDPLKSPAQSRSGSEAPPSPAPAAAVVQPVTRPKLNLAKRTVSEAPDVTSPALASAGDSKPSPFGAARPIDTATREREIEEKRLLALREKKEADEKLKEERRLAKEAAQEIAPRQAPEEEAKPHAAADGTPDDDGGQTPPLDGAGGGNKTSQLGEFQEDTPNAKLKASDSGNWRQPSGDSRGPRPPAPSGPRRTSGQQVPRGPRLEAGRPPRANGGPAPTLQQQQQSQQDAGGAEPAGPDEDGWEKVSTNKGRRNQRARPTAS
jgi:translation initiation factor 4B